MEIRISISGFYSDGQRFSASFDSIEAAIRELEMIEINEHAFDVDTDNTHETNEINLK